MLLGSGRAPRKFRYGKYFTDKIKSEIPEFLERSKVLWHRVFRCGLTERVNDSRTWNKKERAAGCQCFLAALSDLVQSQFNPAFCEEVMNALVVLLVKWWHWCSC